MEIRIAVLSHSQQFLDLMCTMDSREAHIIPKHVDYLHATDTAKDIAPNVDVIIARERTAVLIREAVSVPVVNCDFEAIDFLTTLSQQSIAKDEPVAYIREVSRVNRTLLVLNLVNKLFGYKVELISYTDYASLNDRLQDAIARGIRSIIGAGLATEIAVNLGLRKIELTISPETATAAFQKALLIARSYKQRKYGEHYMTSVLNAMNQPQILVGSDNIVRFISNQALELTGLQQGDLISNDFPQIATSNQLRQLSEGHVIHDVLFSQSKGWLNYTQIPLFDQEESYDGYLLQLNSTPSSTGSRKPSSASHKEINFAAHYFFSDIVGESSSMRHCVRLAAEYAKSDLNVLISGETGTGKELFAHSIHNASPRSSGPFVALNCSTLPTNLLESELFGYEDGAFTGAKKGGKKGFFELANTGTLFLDEIADMPMELQARLLRALQSREIIRVGGTRTIPVDVRILAATNKDLQKAMNKGAFRSDLYYRLSTLLLSIPPLRERREDIPSLVDFFFQEINCAPQERKRIRSHLNRLLNSMSDYAWPGNVRELQSLVYRFSVEYDLIQQGIVKPSDLLRPHEIPHEAPGATSQAFVGSLQEAEKAMISRAGESVAWNRKKMADILGISVSTLYRKLKEYKLP